MLFWYVLPFVLFGIFVFFAWHWWRYRNPYKLIMVFGKKGAGKTTLITKLAMRYNRRGRVCYSTVPVPGVYLFDPSQLGIDSIPPEAVIFVDEVGMVWDSRDYKNFKNHTRDYFKLQRHYHHTVYLFSQSFDIDKKLRDLTDQMYLVRNLFNCFSIARRINKTITIVHAGKNAQGESHLADDMEFDSLLLFWCGSIFITYIPRYAKYFDSFDVPQLNDCSYEYIPPVQAPSLKARLLGAARRGREWAQRFARAHVRPCLRWRNR